MTHEVSREAECLMRCTESPWMPHITTTALESPHLATEICFRRYPAGPPCLNRTKLKNWAENSQSHALTGNWKRFVILQTTTLNMSGWNCFLSLMNFCLALKPLRMKRQFWESGSGNETNADIWWWGKWVIAYFNFHVSGWTGNIFLFRSEQQLPLWTTCSSPLQCQAKRVMIVSV